MPQNLNLPIYNARTRKWGDFSAELTANVLEAIGQNTAHVVLDAGKKPCNKCGKVCSEYVSKPGAIAVWCLDCWIPWKGSR